MADLFCSACATRYPLDPVVWHCTCGGPLDLDGPSGVIPIELGATVTPLLELVDDELDLRVKVESGLPTGSFKDRGSAVLVGLLAAAGVDRAVADSSGNAGVSIAAHCARAGIALDLFVPASASPGKLTQAAAYGAQVHRIDGTREAAAEAARAAVAAGAVYAAHGWSPLFLEGTQGFAIELERQLAGRLPDAIVMPVGSGTLLLGVWQALRHFEQAPRLIAVQSAACAPLATAFAAGSADPAIVVPEAGAAEGVLVARPPRGRQVLAAINASGGVCVSVGETALGAALRRLGHAGIFAEPTAALAIAALGPLVASGVLRPGETVVCAITGHGLKAPGAVAALLGGATP